jgi:hypothetical protein
MDATYIFQKMGIGIVRRNGIYLVSFIKEGFNKIHPEIIDIPGCV